MRKLNFLMLLLSGICSFAHANESSTITINYEHGAIQFGANQQGDVLKIQQGDSSKDFSARYFMDPGYQNNKLFETDTTHLLTRFEKANKKVVVINTIKNKSVDSLTVFFCDADSTFSAVVCGNGSQSPDKDKEKAQHIVPKLRALYWPFLDRTDDMPINKSKKGRLLLIDAHSDPSKRVNNVLLKLGCKEISSMSDMKSKKSLRNNSSLSVFIRNYYFAEVEKVKITVIGKDYKYDTDVRDLIKTVTEADSGKTKEYPVSEDSIDASGKTTVENYLEEIIEQMDKTKYMSINDLPRLEDFKAVIKEMISSASTPEQFKNYQRILSWQPEYISLTDFNLVVPDNDEAEVYLNIQKKGGSTDSALIGRYRLKGGVGAGVYGMVFATNLKNNEVYFDYAQKTAKIDRQNQLSIGVGANAEMYFRTGTFFTPSINMGAFIPLSEELSPFLTLGPGLSFGNGKAKFSISGGVALGKINVINERYKGRSLTDDEISDIANLKLSSSVWKPGYYIGVGFGFNLSTK